MPVDPDHHGHSHSYASGHDRLSWCNPFRPCHCERDEWAPVRMIVAPPVIFAGAWLALAGQLWICWLLVVVGVVFARSGWLTATALAGGLAGGAVNGALPSDLGFVAAAAASSAAVMAVMAVWAMATGRVPDVWPALVHARRPIPAPQHPLHAAYRRDVPVVESITVTRTTETWTVRFRDSAPAPQLAERVDWMTPPPIEVDARQLDRVRRKALPPAD